MSDPPPPPPPPHPLLRLATASAATQSTTPKTLTHLSALAGRAAALHADLLLLPEAYLGGYPRNSYFGCTVGSRTDAGRDEYLDYFRGALDLGDIVGAGGGENWVRKDGAGVTEGDGSRATLEAIAHQHGVFVVAGLVERAGGSLYCAVVYIDPDKGCIGKRRKVMPTGSERLIWAQGSPATLKAVTTTIRGVKVNMAAAICWENYVPLLRQAIYAQNVNLWLAPTADGRDGWAALMRVVSTEGRCFVISANMCVREGGGKQEIEKEGLVDEEELPVPETSQRRRSSVITQDGNEIALPADTSVVPINSQAKDTASTADALAPNFISRGGSCIVSPFGNIIAGPQWEDPEGIIYADVDFDDCVRGRLDLDVAGSYARHDSFKFSVEGLDLTPLPYF